MKDSSKNNTIIAKSAGTVGIAVMMSRVLGLIREQVFAGLFGAGTANDAFVVAFRIPNLLRDLFGEGALSSAFVTVFSDYDQNKTQKQTWQLASNVIVFFGCALSLITLLAIFFSDFIVQVLAPEFDKISGKQDLTILLTRIMMPFLVLISLSAVVMGILNTRKRFFIPALASSFFNLGSIIGGVSLAILLPKWDIPAIIGMAIGTLIGGLLQLAMQLPTLMRCGFKFYPAINFRDPGLIRIIKLMLPAIIGLSATQINLFINTNFASSCMEGSVSWLQYAFRLVQLPIGIFGVAIGIAAMPLLARHAAKKDIESLKHTFVSSLTMVLALTIPAAVGLYLLAEPIIRVIFERGAFTGSDTLATAQALSLYAIGLFAYSANKVLVPVFYAVDKTKYPVIASFITIILNVVFITLTIEYLQHLAIALSMSITMLVNFFFLTLVLYRELGGFSANYLVQTTGKIGAATVVMAVFIGGAQKFAAASLQGTIWYSLTALFFIMLAAAIVYGVCIFFLKVEEFTQVANKMMGILKKRDS